MFKKRCPLHGSAWWRIYPRGALMKLFLIYLGMELQKAGLRWAILGPTLAPFLAAYIVEAVGVLTAAAAKTLGVDQ